jgi:hypothetical protein
MLKRHEENSEAKQLSIIARDGRSSVLRKILAQPRKTARVVWAGTTALAKHNDGSPRSRNSMEQIVGFNTTSLQDERISRIRQTMVRREESLLTRELACQNVGHAKRALVNETVDHPPPYREREDRVPCSF